MPIDPTIRPERDEDHVAIADVITAAFAGKPYADGDEAEVVERLRRAGALAVSLVAELDGALVGQVAFSPAQESSGAQGWYGLGPVAVSPEHQGAGIGSKLIRAGLERITELGAKGCILVGDPGYYARFGFELSPSHCPNGEPAQYFQVKWLGHERPQGRFVFHGAFYGK